MVSGIIPFPPLCTYSFRDAGQKMWWPKYHSLVFVRTQGDPASGCSSLLSWIFHVTRAVSYRSDPSLGLHSSSRINDLNWSRKRKVFEVGICWPKKDLSCTRFKDINDVTKRGLSQPVSVSRPHFSLAAPGSHPPTKVRSHHSEILFWQFQLKSKDWIWWSWFGSCLCSCSSGCGRRNTWLGWAWGMHPLLCPGVGVGKVQGSAEKIHQGALKSEEN